MRARDHRLIVAVVPAWAAALTFWIGPAWLRPWLGSLPLWGQAGIALALAGALAILAVYSRRRHRRAIEAG
jgi:hypothetical protein